MEIMATNSDFLVLQVIYIIFILPNLGLNYKKP